MNRGVHDIELRIVPYFHAISQLLFSCFFPRRPMFFIMESRYASKLHVFTKHLLHPIRIRPLTEREE